MIKGRPSINQLTFENIEQAVSALEIFRHFCTDFKDLRSRFRSDLRDDNNPSCGIQRYSGTYLMKDFTTGETFTWFSYLQAKYPNWNGNEILQAVDSEFNLGLSDTPFKYKANIPNVTLPPMTEEEKIEHQYIFDIIPFTEEALAYWARFGITLTTLMHFKVAQVRSYIHNGENIIPPDLCFVYKIGKGIKIYRPLADRKYKWRGTAGKYDVQGLEQLPEFMPNGEPIVITSSLKDAMALYEMGIHAVAMSSESQCPPATVVDDLYSRAPGSFIYLLLDNDFGKSQNAGQEYAKKILREYPEFINLCLPPQYGAKDVAELAETMGIFNAQYEILNLIIYETSNSVQKLG